MPNNTETEFLAGLNEFGQQSAEELRDRGDVPRKKRRRKEKTPAPTYGLNFYDDQAFKGQTSTGKTVMALALSSVQLVQSSQPKAKKPEAPKVLSKRTQHMLKKTEENKKKKKK